MKQAVVQKHDFGRGPACVAFVAGISYQKTVSILGDERAAQNGFLCKELVIALNEIGLSYEYKYLKPRLKRKIYQDGAIVFMKRSKQYPAGHYLARHDGRWMDPWINFSFDQDVMNAKAGYRKRLPGIPVYALFVCDCI